MSTLYERLGGAAAVDAAVDIFYRKVLMDGRISHFFEGIDMAEQAKKQKAFLTMVFGGLNGYTGKQLREGHAHMTGLNDSHVDTVVELLGATLAELGVPESDIAEVAGIANSVRAICATRKNSWHAAAVPGTPWWWAADYWDWKRQKHCTSTAQG